MRQSGSTLQLSATDLSNFLGCRHRTALDLSVAHGKREAPTRFDAALLILRERGLEHERRYADTLHAKGLTSVNLSEHEGIDAVDRSLQAMHAGADVILQPALRNDRWFGRPDVLQRVEIPSALGSWAYEVIDTKLATETRGGTVLQLALYTDLLATIQRRVPEQFHVVTPDSDVPIQTFRVQDYTAYFRFIRGRLELTTENDPDVIAAANYPEPVSHCDVCRWWAQCDQRRCADDDHLRDWLEQLRAALEVSGTQIPRPVAKVGVPSEKGDERAQRVTAAVAALTVDVPLDARDRSEDQQARWLLAQLLDWHRREDKAPWWEFFRLAALTAEELLDEKAAVSGLQFVSRIGGTARSPIDRYTYPPQETDVREGDTLNLTDQTRFGNVEALDRVARTIDVKKAGAHVENHPIAVFAHSVINTNVLADALLRIADDVIEHGISEGAQFRAARELLRSRPPRLRDQAFEQLAQEAAVQFAVRIALQLDDTVLAIQGPPGAGKTYTGAQMICELVRHGAKVGITAVSHKVIHNLLTAVTKAASAVNLPLHCIQKVTTKSDSPGAIEEIQDNDDAMARLRDGRAHVLGGTQWLWARPDAHELLDVLFVDEAGQMSLANVLAASQSARSVVLLGDLPACFNVRLLIYGRRPVRTRRCSSRRGRAEHFRDAL